MNFTDSHHCKSFAHCATCRTNAAWREVNGAPEECPHEELRKRKQIHTVAATQPQDGVGVELKKILSKFGIKATPTCKCNARAREMDVKGPEWCEENLDTIVSWLKEEADRRKLPFSAWTSRMVVRRAISNYRKTKG